MDLYRVNNPYRVSCSEKPGYCITSTIKLHEFTEENAGMKFISFPVLPSNASPSYVAYDGTLFSTLASALPLSVDSTLELPFVLHITDTMSFLLFSLIIVNSAWIFNTVLIRHPRSHARPLTFIIMWWRTRCFQ